MRESKEPIANLDMSSFIRYRRLQMPRMGNAHAKKHRDAQRDIFERFFPSHPPKEAVHQSRDKDSASLNSDDSGQCCGSGSENTDSLLDGMRSQNTFSSECSSEGNNSNLSSSENESDFLSRDLINRSRDDLDSICSEMRFNRTRDCLSSMPHRGPRPHSTPPPRTVGGGGDGDDDNCPGRKTDHSKGTKKVVGGRSRKIGIQSKLTSGHKHRYKDKTNQSINETTKTNSILLDVLDEDSQSNSGSDSALDTGSGSDAETVSRISISSDDGELASIEKLKNNNNNNSEPNTAMQPRNVESPVNGYRKVLFVCNL